MDRNGFMPKPIYILNLRVHVWHPQQLSKVPPPCHSWFRHGEISHYDHISSPQWQKDMTNPLHTTHISSTQKQKRYNYNHTTPQLHTKLLTSPPSHNPGVSKSFENWVVKSFRDPWHNQHLNPWVYSYMTHMWDQWSVLVSAIFFNE